MREGAALARATEVCDPAGDSTGAEDSKGNNALVVGDEVSLLPLDAVAATGDVAAPEDLTGVVALATGEEASLYDWVFVAVLEAVGYGSGVVVHPGTDRVSPGAPV